MTAITYGAFTYDPEAGTLAGPAEYMSERGEHVVNAMLSGEDIYLNTLAAFAPSVEHAFLSRLQNDYASWRGFRGVARWLDQKPTEAENTPNI